jgi:hypothetical protein
MKSSLETLSSALKSLNETSPLKPIRESSPLDVALSRSLPVLQT